ncbi:hypothetical protein E4U13_001437, partial [Claviceps humidiphila]
MEEVPPPFRPSTAAQTSYVANILAAARDLRIIGPEFEPDIQWLSLLDDVAKEPDLGDEDIVVLPAEEAV